MPLLCKIKIKTVQNSRNKNTETKQIFKNLGIRNS